MVSQIDKLFILQVNLPYLQRRVDLPVIAISAKMGTNLEELLRVIKEIYDKNVTEQRWELFWSDSDGKDWIVPNTTVWIFVFWSCFIYCQVMMAWSLTCKPFTCLYDMFSTHWLLYVFIFLFTFFDPQNYKLNS